MNLSQVAFARRAGLDATQLASYEHGRARLNYFTAWKILTAFKVSPTIFTTGDRSWLQIAIPSPEEVGAGPRTPFSEIYNKKLAAIVAQAVEELRFQKPPKRLRLHVTAQSPFGRLMAEAKLVNWIKRHILCLPDSHLEEWINEVYNRGNNLTDSYVADPDPVFKRRLDEMEHARAQIEANKSSLATAAQSQEENLSQALLDNKKIASNTCGVKTEDQAILSLPALLKAVRARVKERGQKTALANHLKVSRQAVDQWLSGDAKPSADLTFALLNWVEQQKRQE